MGLVGLKSIAVSFTDSADGLLAQFYLGVPEANRQGLFKLFAPEPKDCRPPAFIPADAVEFQRVRLDGQKSWETVEKTLKEISPMYWNAINFLIESANVAVKQKDPDFDLRKNLINNLGDDMISYEKPPRGTALAELRFPPSMILLGLPDPARFAAALKAIFVVISPTGAAPKEREFLWP